MKPVWFRQRAATVDHLEAEQLMLKSEKCNRRGVTRAIPQHNTFPSRVCYTPTDDDNEVRRRCPHTAARDTALVLIYADIFPYAIHTKRA